MSVNNRNIRRVITFGLGMALGLSFLSGPAAAATVNADKGRGNQGQTSSTKDCDGTHHSKTGHGANDDSPHAYNETCDEDIASGNGAGDGEAGGKPCAGCVGNADDKNPKGQYPSGPEDHNNGYECDQKGRSENEGNNGIGFGNPAHSGCEGNVVPDDEEPPVSCPAADSASMTSHSYVVDATDVADLTGNVDTEDHVVANFTITGCDELPVALVAYEIVDGNRTKVDEDAGSFAAGSHDLDVDVPRCAFAVEFIVDGEVIDSDEDMNASCDEPIVPVTPAGGDLVVGPAGQEAISAAGVVPAALEATPSVLGSDLVAETVAAPEARVTEVQGVQLERAAADPAVAGAGLARTGLTLLPVAGLGTALCLLGIALSSARRRNDGQAPIAIGDRLAGF